MVGKVTRIGECMASCKVCKPGEHRAVHRSAAMGHSVATFMHASLEASPALQLDWEPFSERLASACHGPVGHAHQPGGHASPASDGCQAAALTAVKLTAHHVLSWCVLQGHRTARTSHPSVLNGLPMGSVKPIPTSWWGLYGVVTAKPAAKYACQVSVWPTSCAALATVIALHTMQFNTMQFIYIVVGCITLILS